MRPVRHRPRAPHPRRYLLLILLLQNAGSVGIAAHVLVRPEISILEAVLGGARTNALILLSLGTDSFPVLRAVSTELYNILARLLDQAFADRHRLARLVFP